MNPACQPDDDQKDIMCQVKFWYGKCYDMIQRGEVDRMSELIKASTYGQQITSLLTLQDTTEEHVRQRYGSFGTYRFKHAARVMQDWIDHDVDGHLTDKHRFPITLVDCIGPFLPVIGYNRIISQNTYGMLWPLDYHVDIALKGLQDDTPFEAKVNKVVFKGALSGPLDHTKNSVTGSGIKTSRVRVVEQYDKPDNSSWCDIGITFVPREVELSQPITLHPRETQESILQNKYVLCIEGADISSGLGAVLASHAVPFCPFPFVYEVWYFNGLIPMVHFIPLKQDCSDLKEKYDWCEANPDLCARISAAGRAHMQKMLDPERLKKIKQGVVKLWPILERS